MLQDINVSVDVYVMILIVVSSVASLAISGCIMTYVMCRKMMRETASEDHSLSKLDKMVFDLAVERRSLRRVIKLRNLAYDDPDRVSMETHLAEELDKIIAFILRQNPRADVNAEISSRWPKFSNKSRISAQKLS